MRPSGYSASVVVWIDIADLPDDALEGAKIVVRETLAEEIAQRGLLLEVDMDTMVTSVTPGLEEDGEGLLQSVVTVTARVGFK